MSHHVVILRVVNVGGNFQGPLFIHLMANVVLTFDQFKNLFLRLRIHYTDKVGQFSF